MTGLYDIPAAHFRARAAVTNTPPTNPYRSAECGRRFLHRGRSWEGRRRNAPGPTSGGLRAR